MSFAIIETGGKQYKVSASKILEIEKLNAKVGEIVKFKNVLLLNDNKNTEIGNPSIEGATVTGYEGTGVFQISQAGNFVLAFDMSGASLPAADGAYLGTVSYEATLAGSTVSLGSLIVSGAEGSFSCQGGDWDGSPEQVNCMQIAVAGVASQWIQRWFIDNENVADKMVLNV